MHDQLARSWTVAQLARTAALSRSAFFDRFTRTVGLRPMEYLLAWRMAVAKDLLRRHDLGIAEVAERVGYGSASTFSTAFNRYVGQSPGGMRGWTSFQTVGSGDNLAVPDHGCLLRVLQGLDDGLPLAVADKGSDVCLPAGTSLHCDRPDAKTTASISRSAARCAFEIDKRLSWQTRGKNGSAIPGEAKPVWESVSTRSPPGRCLGQRFHAPISQTDHDVAAILMAPMAQPGHRG
jgi:AraC-like DNA-binding protein